MFFRHYISRLKRSFRSPYVLIWTLIFPIGLGTFFKVGLGGLDEMLHLSPIASAMVESNKSESTLLPVLETMSKEGENQILDLTIVKTREAADRLLENGEISGYFLDEETPRLVLKSNGMEQTVLKSLLDQYMQLNAAALRLLAENPRMLQEGLFERISQTASFTQEGTLGVAPVTQVLGYFLALLGMLCMFGSYQGLDTVTSIQADLSALGARRSVSPAQKGVMVLSDLFAGFTVQLACVFVVTAYIAFVLNIDFGRRIGGILLVCILGSLVGVSTGSMVTCIFRGSENVKSGILTLVSLLFSFLSGMMVSGIQYAIARSLPVLSWINPVARISDAFYCLYFYDSLDRYFLNILVLSVMAILMNVISVFVLRRQSYASI